MQDCYSTHTGRYTLPKIRFLLSCLKARLFALLLKNVGNEPKVADGALASRGISSAASFRDSPKLPPALSWLFDGVAVEPGTDRRSKDGDEHKEEDVEVALHDAGDRVLFTDPGQEK